MGELLEPVHSLRLDNITSMEEDPRPKTSGLVDRASAHRIERTPLIPYPLDLALSRPIS